MKIFKINMCMIILNMDYESYISNCIFGISIVFIIISVVINGGGKDWAVMFGGAHEKGVERCYLVLL